MVVRNCVSRPMKHQEYLCSLLFLVLSVRIIVVCAGVCSLGEPFKNAQGEELCCGQQCQDKAACPSTHECYASNQLSICCEHVAPVPQGKVCPVPSGGRCQNCNQDEQEVVLNGKHCPTCQCASVSLCRQSECSEGQACHVITQCQEDPDDCTPYAECLDICGLPLDIGGCGDFQESWYFDSSDNICKRFNYGGCNGNENRFKTREQCLNTCLPDCLKVACDPCNSGHTHKRDGRGCVTCECVPVSSCQEMDCGVGEMCEMKDGKPTCSGSSPVGPTGDPVNNGCPMPKCKPCEGGERFVLDTQGCHTCQCVDPAPCQGMSCSGGQVCRMVQVQCFTTPCNPQPTCIDNPCDGQTVCTLDCGSKEMMTDPYGCSLCTCDEQDNSSGGEGQKNSPGGGQSRLAGAYGLVILLLCLLTLLF